MTRLYCPQAEDADYHAVKVPSFDPRGDELICPDHGCMMRSFKPRRSTLSRSKKGKGGGLRKGRGFAASPAQQSKVKGLPCTVCGRDGYETQIHAAHVYPRRLQSCECAEGVVPLCAPCHSLADDPNRPFDLLPALVTRGYHAELVHAVAAHGAPLSELIYQVTGTRWQPVEREAA